MSYNDAAYYVAETNMKNRLKADAKPTVGIISGGNVPLIKPNDIAFCLCSNSAMPYQTLVVLPYPRYTVTHL